MEIFRILELGSPFILIGVLLFLEIINVKLTVIQEDIAEIKKGMIWKNTCNIKHEEINRRLARIEQARA